MHNLAELIFTNRFTMEAGEEQNQEVDQRMVDGRCRVPVRGTGAVLDQVRDGGTRDLR